jgi:hypothetical protein
MDDMTAVSLSQGSLGFRAREDFYGSMTLRYGNLSFSSYHSATGTYSKPVHEYMFLETKPEPVIRVNSARVKLNALAKVIKEQYG